MANLGTVNVLAKDKRAVYVIFFFFNLFSVQIGTDVIIKPGERIPCS